MAGQIDEVSRAIGRIDQYIHDNNHAMNNLAMAVEGAAEKMSRDVRELNQELNQRISELDSSYKLATEAALTSIKTDLATLTMRVALLEMENSNRKAVGKFVRGISAIPGIMWLFGGGFMVASYLIGKFGVGGVK